MLVLRHIELAALQQRAVTGDSLDFTHVNNVICGIAMYSRFSPMPCGASACAACANMRAAFWLQAQIPIHGIDLRRIYMCSLRL